MKTARRPSFVLGWILLGAGCAPHEPDAPWGRIEINCASGEEICGPACVSLADDALNCGGCGIPCGAAEACIEGVCTCQVGVRCGGQCVAAGSPLCGAALTLPTLVTSVPGAYGKTDGSVETVSEGSCDGDCDITVNESATAQVWEGFGGAFNERGWEVLSLLSEEARTEALRLLFGDQGARFAFGRIPIGASDYAMDRYTLAESAEDFDLTSFTLRRDHEKLIPFVKAAQAIKGDIRFWASPWTPPTWMKAGPYQQGKEVSAFDGGSMKSDDATLGAFAHYLTRFVQSYAEEGIPVEAISAQNEPSYAGNYPTCLWTPATYTTFIGRHLGPAFENAGLATKIILGTFNGGGADPAIVRTVMTDPLARTYVKALGYQWGMIAHVGQSQSYHLPLWQTEHKAGNYPWGPSFNATTAPNDDAFALESWGLIRDWIRAGVTAYSAWNMVLDTGGVGIDTTRRWPQNALLTVDRDTRTWKLTPTYHIFRHVSQFVRTGARVIGVKGLDALAFKNPDSTVVVVMRNPGDARSILVAAAGKKVRFEAPARGWATLVVGQ